MCVGASNPSLQEPVRGGGGTDLQEGIQKDGQGFFSGSQNIGKGHRLASRARREAQGF